VKITNGWVLYVPPTGYTNTDTFGYEVSDGHGGTARGGVTVNVNQTALVEARSLAIQDLGNGSLRLVFSGIPGRTYTIQCTDDVAQPVWQTLGTFAANASGIYEYVDTPPSNTGMRLYRSAYQP
jgi:hypothetical protein